MTESQDERFLELAFAPADGGTGASVDRLLGVPETVTLNEGQRNARCLVLMIVIPENLQP